MKSLFGKKIIEVNHIYGRFDLNKRIRGEILMKILMWKFGFLWREVCSNRQITNKKESIK